MTQEEFKELSQGKPIIWEQSFLRERGLHFVDRIVAAVHYHSHPLLKRAIHRFKYKKVRGLEMQFVTLLDGAADRIHIGSETPVLCAVPLHWMRRFSRGFNQAECLAAALSQKKGWELSCCLRRVRATGHQVHRKKEERLRALTDAFVAPDFVPPFVLLIDDLSTTGATFDACAKALKIAGAKRVEGLAIAQG